MRIFTLTFIAACLFTLFTAEAWSQKPSPQTNKTPPPAEEAPQLSVCYNKEFPPISFAAFSLITVDPSYPALSLEVINKSGKSAFARLSINKVDPAKGWFKPLAESGAFKKSPDPSKPQTIDLSNPAWEDLLMQALIPQLIKKGFTGLYLDDLDLSYQQKQHGQAAALISNIRKNFPELKLIANGGLEFLPSFALHIDYILLENRIAKQQKLTSISQVVKTLELLKLGKKVNPKLIPLALDYYAPVASGLNAPHLLFIATLRKLHWEYGLASCVTVESLDAVPIRPLN